VGTTMFKFQVFAKTRGDAEFLLDVCSGHASTNSIDAEITEVEEALVPATLFTADQRAMLIDRVDLMEYASTHICGDGLEIDRARQDIEEMDDVGVVLHGLMQGEFSSDDEDDYASVNEEWERILRAKLAGLPPDVIETAVTEAKKY
jgi:hypothetical protein